MLALEKALSRRGISVSEALDDAEGVSYSPRTSGFETAAASCDDTISEASGERDETTTAEEEESIADLDRLHLDDLQTSNLVHYGPTSALNHLSTAPQALQSPFTIENDMERIHAGRMTGPELGLAWARVLPDIGMSGQTHDKVIELCESFFAPWCWVCRRLDFLDAAKYSLECSGCQYPRFQARHALMFELDDFSLSFGKDTSLFSTTS